MIRKDKQTQEMKAAVTFGQFMIPLTVIIALALLFFSMKLFFYTPLNPDDSVVMQQEDEHIKRMIQEKQKGDKNINNHKTLDSGSAHTKKSQIQNSEKSKKTINKDEEHVAVVTAKPDKKKAVSLDTHVYETDTKKEASARPVSKNTAKTAVSAASDKRMAQKKTADKNTQSKTETEKTVNSTKKKENRAIVNLKQNNAAKAQTSAKTDSVKNLKRWDVQVGVFADKKNAEALINKAKNEGFDAYLMTVAKNSVMEYKVRVRGSSDKNSAQNIASKLSSKGYVVYLAETD